MTSAGSLRAVAAGLAAGIAMTSCGHSAPVPALDATGTKAFLYDITHRKFAGATFAGSKDSQVLSLGQALCGSLDKGHTVAQLDAGLVATKSLQATPAEDGAFLTTAVAALCPKYASQYAISTSPTPKASSH